MTGPRPTSPMLTGRGDVAWVPLPDHLHTLVHRHPSGGALWLGGSWARGRARYDTVISCAPLTEIGAAPRCAEHELLPMTDGPHLPDPDHLAVAVDLVVADVQLGFKVLVRCYAGLNRSALVAGLALTRLTDAPGAEIITGLRAARSPHVLCNPVFAAEVAALRRTP